MESLECLLKPVEVRYSDRCGNLDVEASGVVKSKKYFPIYNMEGVEYIFKPLSKTKPLTTDLFSYAEVYWSYVMKKYFDGDVPLYKLAYCRGIEEKYYEQGTLVPKIGNGKFINLLEYFKSYPESSFDISDYVNYCMKDYDYTSILNSSFIKNNRLIGEKLAYQILLSILRMDQNFHYENVNMCMMANGLDLVPPIDSEFSTPFLYPENSDGRKYYIDKYMRSLVFPTSMQWEISKLIGDDFSYEPVSVLFKNIYEIDKNYKEVVDKFLSNLEAFYKDIDSINLSDRYGFIGLASSDYWMIGHSRYKENNEEKARELETQISKVVIDKEYLFSSINNDIKMICEKLKNIILGIRLLKKKGYDSLDTMTIDRLGMILDVPVLDGQIDSCEVLKKIKDYK